MTIVSLYTFHIVFFSLQWYRWVPLYPNIPKSKLAFIRCTLKTISNSLLFYSAHLIWNLLQLTDFYMVLFVRIKRDPPVHLSSNEKSVSRNSEFSQVYKFEERVILTETNFQKQKTRRFFVSDTKSNSFFGGFVAVFVPRTWIPSLPNFVQFRLVSLFLHKKQLSANFCRN